ncbi:hypothetical protein [Chryseolinea soli]|uniref:Uncharacterized protein n=1 Tax=Chryseolinea soli TaxID=2321403 RepID=A0A385SLA0_9BACT|nr:hypothetical protein [Chryseolinea soli]AYB32019.1 hypothetical protein D4L85_16235 [Chryseolinea soli]
MMKRTLVAIILISGVMITCDENVEVGDVLYNLKLEEKETPADGQSTIKITVNLNDRSSADRRSVIFATTAGTFTSSSTSKYTAKAEFLDGLLTATATLRAPVSPGKIGISVQPEFDSPIKDFIVSDTIEAVKSSPATIHLEASALGLSGNFLTEVRLEGLLKNDKGKNVSKGAKVAFEDFLQDGTKANGRYRQLQLASSDTSYVTSYYGAPFYPIGTNIKIRVTVLNDVGAKTNVKDSLLLTVNQ